MDKFRFLILDGQLGVNNGLKNFLANQDFILFPVNRVSDAVRVLNNQSIDVAVVEMEEPAVSRLDFLKTMSRKYPQVEVVVVDKGQVVEQAKCRSRSTVVDYLHHPVDWRDIEQSIMKTKSYLKYLNDAQSIDKVFRFYTEEIKKRNGPPILGVSASIKMIAQMILKIAATEDTSVLITGESGVGKELVARGIHAMSDRHNHEFHAVNCSAIPDALFESEFFGYNKGAFTGAVEKSTGWFELANHGTLFLDEITELPLTMQPKFLRVLDNKSINKIGSHQEIRINLRIISATNKEYATLCKGAGFRRDLFYRLCSFHIHVPPLRERKEDIPVLLKHYIAEFSKKLRKPEKPVSEGVIERLTNYEFPGNVRELKNIVERAVLLCEDDILKQKHFRLDSPLENEPRHPVPSGKEYNLNEIERMAISEALSQANFNKTKAAKLLGISRQALDRKMQKPNS